LAKECGDLRGVRVSRNHSLTHLLFVDDVLLFGMKCAGEWQKYHEIFKEFCEATGMEINLNKSCFLSMEEVMDQDILTLFPINHKCIDEGIKYLGFQLKPNGYNKSDWLWLIERVENKIGLWCYRWLSLGGRLILIKSVLEGIPVYWMTLYKIPKVILNMLSSLVASYLWSGSSHHEKIHLAKWTTIARPRSLGGWGIKDLETFGRALRMKTMWRFLTTDSIWCQICCDKYLRSTDKISWFMKGHRTWGYASPIWRGLLETRQWIHPGLTWEIGAGNKIWLNEIFFDKSMEYILSP